MFTSSMTRRPGVLSLLLVLGLAMPAAAAAKPPAAVSQPVRVAQE
ncbi:MAG: hypothetical protein ACR2P2_18940 [Nakamurella sp.]